MKKVIKIMISLVSVLTFCTGVIQANDSNLKETDYLKKYELVLKDFQDKIAMIEKTGDFNVDFLNQILAYEQMGIEMGKSELQFGDNKKLKEATNDSVKVMKKGVREIEKLLKVMIDEPIVDEVKEAEYLELYKSSYDEMLLALQLEKDGEVVKKTGSVDRDFLTKFMLYLEFKAQFINHVLEKSEHEHIKKLASDLMENNEIQLEIFKKLEESIQ